MSRFLTLTHNEDLLEMVTCTEAKLGWMEEEKQEAACSKLMSAS